MPLYDFVLITTGRPGTTQRFIAVDLLIYIYFLFSFATRPTLEPEKSADILRRAFRETVGWPGSQNIGLFSQAKPHWSGFETNLRGKKPLKKLCRLVIDY